MELNEIRFLAQIINQQKSLQQGYAAAPRWLTLRKDLQEQYLKEAKEMVDNWRNEELEAKKRRNEF